MDEPIPPIQPQEIPVSQEDLRTKVLELRGPTWSYGGNRYEANQMAVSIVDFLTELQEASVDRGEHSDVATFTSQRTEIDRSYPLLLQQQFNRDLADSILNEATRRNLDVACIYQLLPGNQGAIAHRANRFRPIEDAVGISGALRKLLKRTDNLSPKLPPSFILKTSLDFTGPETSDLQRDTWSYKELLHSVSLVKPGSLPIRYDYYSYGEK